MALLLAAHLRRKSTGHKQEIVSDGMNEANQSTKNTLLELSSKLVSALLATTPVVLLATLTCTVQDID